MNEKRPTFPVGVNVIVVRNGKLLLGKRKNAFRDGSWGLPGGHLEDREPMEAAAARELKEETGLVATKYTFSNIVNDTRLDKNYRHYIQIGFVAEGISGEVKLMEPDRCSEWHWFKLDELPENIFFGHEKQIELYKRDGRFTDH